MSTGTRDIAGRHRYPVRVCALLSNSFYIGYRRFENFIKSFIMDIRRAISATHSVRGLSHTKVPSAEVGKVAPQNFAQFCAAERPLPPSPITRRGPSENQSRSGILTTTSPGQRLRSRSGLFAGLFRHPFCLKLYQVKSCKWLVGTPSHLKNAGSYNFLRVDGIGVLKCLASKLSLTASRSRSITYCTRNNTLSIG